MYMVSLAIVAHAVILGTVAIATDTVPRNANVIPKQVTVLYSPLAPPSPHAQAARNILSIDHGSTSHVAPPSLPSSPSSLAAHDSDDHLASSPSLIVIALSESFTQDSSQMPYESLSYTSSAPASSQFSHQDVLAVNSSPLSSQQKIGAILGSIFGFLFLLSLGLLVALLFRRRRDARRIRHGDQEAQTVHHLNDMTKSTRGFKSYLSWPLRSSRSIDKGLSSVPLELGADDNKAEPSQSGQWEPADLYVRYSQLEPVRGVDRGHGAAITGPAIVRYHPPPTPSLRSRLGFKKYLKWSNWSLQRKNPALGSQDVALPGSIHTRIQPHTPSSAPHTPITAPNLEMLMPPQARQHSRRRSISSASSNLEPDSESGSESDVDVVPGSQCTDTTGHSSTIVFAPPPVVTNGRKHVPAINLTGHYVPGWISTASSGAILASSSTVGVLPVIPSLQKDRLVQFTDVARPT